MKEFSVASWIRLAEAVRLGMDSPQTSANPQVSSATKPLRVITMLQPKRVYKLAKLNCLHIPFYSDR
jgi:hypothetical protein